MTNISVKVDPFTRVYDALVALFANHDGVQDLVKTGNLIDYSGDRTEPTKENIQAGDVPELEVRPAGGEGQLWFSSTSATVVRRYAVGLTTGDLRAAKSLFPLEWQLIRALAGTTDDLGLSFVHKVSIEGFDEEREATDRHRGTRGWVAVFAVVVEMNFDKKNHLLAAEPDFGA